MFERAPFLGDVQYIYQRKHHWDARLIFGDSTTLVVD